MIGECYQQKEGGLNVQIVIGLLGIICLAQWVWIAFMRGELSYARAVDKDQSQRLETALNRNSELLRRESEERDQRIAAEREAGALRAKLADVSEALGQQITGLWDKR